jgi:hypothetical protein
MAGKNALILPDDKWEFANVRGRDAAPPASSDETPRHESRPPNPHPPRSFALGDQMPLYRMPSTVHLSAIVSRQKAISVKGLSIAERKARVAALVAEGKVSAKHAAMIDYREPTASERAIAERLAPGARKALQRKAARTV